LKLLAVFHKLTHSCIGFGPFCLFALPLVLLRIAKLLLDVAHLLADFLQRGLKVARFGIPAVRQPLQRQLKLTQSLLQGLSLAEQFSAARLAFGSGKFAVNVPDLVTDCTQPGLKLAGLYIPVVRQLFKLALNSAYLPQ
jgi:hypothetical protein